MCDLTEALFLLVFVFWRFITGTHQKNIRKHTTLTAPCQKGKLMSCELCKWYGNIEFTYGILAKWSLLVACYRIMCCAVLCCTSICRFLLFERLRFCFDAILKYNHLWWREKKQTPIQLISKVSVFHGMSNQFANLLQNWIWPLWTCTRTHKQTHSDREWQTNKGLTFLFPFYWTLWYSDCLNLSNLRLYHNEYYPKQPCALARDCMQHVCLTHMTWMCVLRVIEIANFCHLLVCGPWIFQLCVCGCCSWFFPSFAGDFIFDQKPFVFYFVFHVPSVCFVKRDIA